MDQAESFPAGLGKHFSVGIFLANHLDETLNPWLVDKFGHSGYFVAPLIFVLFESNAEAGINLDGQIYRLTLALMSRDGCFFPHFKPQVRKGFFQDFGVKDFRFDGYEV
jgi:hypothetical protein